MPFDRRNVPMPMPPGAPTAPMMPPGQMPPPNGGNAPNTRYMMGPGGPAGAVIPVPGAPPPMTQGAQAILNARRGPYAPPVRQAPPPMQPPPPKAVTIGGPRPPVVTGPPSTPRPTASGVRGRLPPRRQKY